MDVAVYCGSLMGENPLYQQTAETLGQKLAREGHRIVYGGGHVGLMRAVADAALAAGGHVTGVMPKALVDCEISHPGLSELIVVETMHERKTKMSELADAFVALPGGAGTMEEIFEQWTWAQLGIHTKPCAFVNVNGYFDAVKTLAFQMAKEGFMKQAYAEMLFFETDLDALLEAFATYEPPPRKWLSADEQVRP